MCVTKLLLSKMCRILGDNFILLYKIFNDIDPWFRVVKNWVMNFILSDEDAFKGVTFYLVGRNYKKIIIYLLISTNVCLKQLTCNIHYINLYGNILNKQSNIN